MKNFIAFLSLLLIPLLASSAFAIPKNPLPWNMDFSTIGYEASIDADPYQSQVRYDELMNIQNAGSAVPPSIITQELGDDGILNDGDPFSEFGILRSFGVDGSTVNFRDTDTEASRRVYLSFTGLEGTITDFNNDSGVDITTSNFISDPNILEDIEFDLEFTPNAGSISLLAGPDFDPDNAEYILANYSLLEGRGTAPELDEGGEPNGALSFSLGIDSVTNNIWSFDDGTLFEDWMAAYGIPSIFGLVDVNAANTDVALTEDEQSFLFTVENSGTYRTSAVPEPTTLLLFGTGLLGLAFCGRKKLMRRS